MQNDGKWRSIEIRLGVVVVIVGLFFSMVGFVSSKMMDNALDSHRLAALEKGHERLCRLVDGNGEPPHVIHTDKFNDYVERNRLSMEKRKAESKGESDMIRQKQEQIIKAQNTMQVDLKEIKKEVQGMKERSIRVETLIKRLVDDERRGDDTD